MRKRDQAHNLHQQIERKNVFYCLRMRCYYHRDGTTRQGACVCVPFGHCFHLKNTRETAKHTRQK